MIGKFREIASMENQRFVGREEVILIEGVCIKTMYLVNLFVFKSIFLQTSKRSEHHVYGRNDANIKVIIPAKYKSAGSRIDNDCVVGDWVKVRIVESNSQVLKAVPLCHLKTL